MSSFNICYSKYPDILNTDEVCEILNINKSQCLQLLKKKKIKGFHVNSSRVWKIPKPAIKDYWDNAKSS